jgi:hypothetical protein
MIWALALEWKHQYVKWNGIQPQLYVLETDAVIPGTALSWQP